MLVSRRFICSKKYVEMFGHIDSKVRTNFEPIEIAELGSIVNIPKEEKTEEKLINEEMERRMRKGFPRWRWIRSHELKDAEEKKKIEKLAQINQ